WTHTQWYFKAGQQQRAPSLPRSSGRGLLFPMDSQVCQQGVRQYSQQLGDICLGLCRRGPTALCRHIQTIQDQLPWVISNISLHP
uniref:Uncharacterized protein n=1 Tax=Gopherus evgoodei TaxID=1825980 RepID=A0A8C4W426_9SAUR